MKVVILAGGYGTRLSEYTDSIPKPMVEIGGYPILWHIMRWYASFGHSDFYIALGYKSEFVKRYFAHYHIVNSDFSVDLGNGSITPIKNSKVNWKVTLVDTGNATMTGGRVKRLASHIGNEPFLLTYGDGLSNVNIKKLIDFHNGHRKIISMTAVHPSARFGELEISNDKVISFEEKPQLQRGWINGGFFVMQPEVFSLIESDEIMLEREPLNQATKMEELMAYKHTGFWQCMDTKRDHDLLQNLWKEQKAPWVPQ